MIEAHGTNEGLSKKNERRDKPHPRRSSGVAGVAEWDN
jgi:hypothetical protein